MSYQTIVVAFDTAERATAAIRDVRRMGVPAGDIGRHSADADAAGDLAQPATSEAAGFWAWLCGGGGQQRERRLHHATGARGGTVLSVRVMEDEAVGCGAFSPRTRRSTGAEGGK